MKIKNGKHSVRGYRAVVALLPCAISLALAACGGGGGGSGVRSTPPPAPVPTTPPPTGGVGFTPNVANDASLTVNPPVIPNLAPPITFATASLNRHLSLINAQGALGAGLKGEGVTIGILDSGANRSHPALSGRVISSFTHVSSPPNNLSIDDVVGHGTTVSSLAAGRPVLGNYLNQDGTNSGSTGIWGGGVAQDANIASSRFISDKRPTDDGSGGGNEIFAGQGYGDYFRSLNAELANAGARIINNSWGGLYWNDPALTVELATAWKDFIVNRGGIVVFANGNSGRDSRFLDNPSDNAALPTLANDPALEKGWLTVGALDPDNPTSLTDYSQRCGIAMNYCLVAPGNVVFIDPKATSQATSGLFQGGGSSYAAPLVSGAAAVVWSAFPYFNNDLVRQTLLGSAKDLGAPGVDAIFGWGLLDVSKAANGPSNFAWGDVSVSFSGNSVWRNSIIGNGGLNKAGSGILTLAESANFTGATDVQAGGLDIRKGLRSNLSIANGATVWGSGSFGGNVSNNGRFLSGSTTPATIAGNYTQSSSGNVGVWLGSTLKVTGAATLAGTMSILGVKTGYTTTLKETLLNAVGGVSGTFSTLNAAPSVFLDATLGYDPNNVFLNINRIDVTKAIAGMGVGEVTMSSAVRVESAMSLIDAQLAGSAPAGIGSRFIEAAGDLQRSSSRANAEFSLRSLSGELHASSAAMTFDAIDAGRRALDGRLQRLAHSRNAVGGTGGWFRDLSSSGTLAQSGYDTVGLQASGEMIGNDWQAGPNTVIGIGINRIQQSSWLGAFGDRSRGHQRELQLYSATWRGDWYGQGQVALGSFERQLQRNVFLGERRDAAATQQSGSYSSASAEIGRRVNGIGGIALTPYLGSQFLHIANDGFSETSETGFGLRANAWDSTRWQGFAGLRADRGWRVGNIDLRTDVRTEWQQTLASRGEVFDASFTGLSQWAPLQGIALGNRSSLLGLGVSAKVGGNKTFRFDLSHRASGAGASTMASLQALYRF
ncbi:MAG: S8 family serine peptidase [Pseudomonadota bacterium]|nr:S8 family serine peptidase [Pseudomonadota bacterium]MDQ3159986.1 S8 family serine peptidase [Pseudomonadota bacterium]